MKHKLGGTGQIVALVAVKRWSFYVSVVDVVVLGMIRCFIMLGFKEKKILVYSFILLCDLLV